MKTGSHPFCRISRLAKYMLLRGLQMGQTRSHGLPAACRASDTKDLRNLVVVTSGLGEGVLHGEGRGSIRSWRLVGRPVDLDRVAVHACWRGRRCRCKLRVAAVALRIQIRQVVPAIAEP